MQCPARECLRARHLQATLSPSMIHGHSQLSVRACIVAVHVNKTKTNSQQKHFLDWWPMDWHINHWARVVKLSWIAQVLRSDVMSWVVRPDVIHISWGPSIMIPFCPAFPPGPRAAGIVATVLPQMLLSRGLCMCKKTTAWTSNDKLGQWDSDTRKLSARNSLAQQMRASCLLSRSAGISQISHAIKKQ